MKKLIFLLFIAYNSGVFAQAVGINDDGSAPHSSAILDIKSYEKGLLIPRMSTAERNNISFPAQGLIVFDSNELALYIYTSTSWKLVGDFGPFIVEDNVIRPKDFYITNDFIVGRDSLPQNGEDLSTNTRMLFFDKSKGALRAGRATAIQWAPDSIGQHSTAFGADNVALGSNSMSGGRNNKASGISSFALGENVNAQSAFEFVVGRYNENYIAASEQSFDASDKLFVVGNGKGPTLRNDAFVIHKNGEAEMDGPLTIKGGASPYTLPSSDGNAGQLIKTDGSGNLLWSSITSGSNISDIDEDTEINVEDTPDEDEIKFKIQGHEFAKMDGKTFHLAAPDSSLFIGINSGLMDDGTGHKSTGVGFETLKNDATGWHNTAVGFQALSDGDAGDNNTALGAFSMKNTHYGDFNVAVGTSTLFENTSGAGNVAIGYQALKSNIGAQKNVAIGHRTMVENTSGELNIAIGARTLHENVTCDKNIAIGDSALHNNGSGTLLNPYEGEDNIAIGINSGLPITRGYGNVLVGNSTYSEGGGQGIESTIIGHQAGNKTGAGENVMVGAHAGQNFSDGEANVFLGNYAGQNNVDSENVFIGYAAGKNNEGSGNVFLGNRTGENESGSSNILMIDNSNTSSPLIYGEFDNNLVKINGQLNINNEFTFPTVDGSTDQILVTDGLGNLSWNSPTSGNILEDADMDTKILVEQSADDDVIRFRAGGREILKMSRNGQDDYMVEPGILNTFYGNQAGLNNEALQSGEGLYNTFIGVRAGKDNSEGADNTILGHDAGEELNAGSKNVYIGKEAGNSNVNGSNNVFIGYQAGADESTSNKLFIDNTNTSDPLIYGEFNNDKLRINGELEIGTAYTFPTTDGSVNQVITTDGTGTLSWGDSTGSQWEDNVNDRIYYTEGNVGIGKTVPDVPLDVFSNFNAAQVSSIGLSPGNKTALQVTGTNAFFVTAPDSIIGIRTSAGGSTGANIALFSEVFNDVDLAAKFDGRVVLGNSHTTNNQVLISPSNTTQGGNASVFLGEDTDGTFGMYWEYDGAINKMRLFGKANDVVYGPHITVNRNDGVIELGNDDFIFDPDFAGNSRFTTDELEIRGGSDLAEFFDVSNVEKPEAGTLVSIDPHNPGKLLITSDPYCPLLAGVISGANGIKPGMLMGQKETIAYGEYPVTLTGRVYVKANNLGGNIKPGDLLTSSSVKGESMKADKTKLEFGACIGKALSFIDENGYVLALISLR